MKVLYLDCTSGISGDMTLAALLDLGVNKEFLVNELNKLNVDGYELNIQKKERHSIQMTDVDVILQEQDNERNLDMIKKVIDESSISQNAKEMSKRIFTVIAEAEAKVHGKSIGDVHFHEVGAIDSIVDIVGVAICIDFLNADMIYASPLHDGHGFIPCRHGLLPVPVPAVMAMLEDSNIPVVQEDVNTEMITPTGMGIIKCLAEDFIRMPAMKVEKVGYGMGKRDTGRFGAVRAILGKMQEV